MSQSLNRAASNVGRFSSHSPNVRGFGQRARAQREIDDVQSGPAWSPKDYAEYLADAIETVESHALVTEFGFAADCLITKVNTDKPVPMGFEVLAIALAGARAAKTLGIDPKSIGVDGLFRKAAEFQGEIEARAEAARKAAEDARIAAENERRKPGARLTLPGRNRTPAARPAPVNPRHAQLPQGSDHLGRLTSPHGFMLICTCGCGVRMLESVAMVPNKWETKRLLGRNPEVFDLWRVARAPRCIRNGFLFTEAVKAMQETDAGLKGNDVIGDGTRLSHYVTPLPDGVTAKQVENMLSQDNLGSEDWDRIHTILRTRWLSEQELVSARIRKDVPTQREVLDLRRYVTLLRGAKKHEQNLRDREERQRQWEEEHGKPSAGRDPAPQGFHYLEENPLLASLLRRARR